MIPLIGSIGFSCSAKEYVMQILDLKGNWQLSQDGALPIPGFLPGCTYLDYMANGMEDPFYGENERTATELGHHRYTYSRTFTADPGLLAHTYVEFVGDGLDTVMDIYLNDSFLGHAENINRSYRFDAKALLREGENSIRLEIRDPYEYMKECQKKNPIMEKGIPFALVGHIRKTPCHFSWDWGPQLAPAGVVRSIGFEAYDNRMEDIQIHQNHKDGAVRLEIRVFPTFMQDASCEVLLTDPDGQTAAFELSAGKDCFETCIEVEHPQLWWCNGLGDQPLYQLTARLKMQGREIEVNEKKIGLRTIELDTAKDQYGEQFRFKVNGVPIFAKGGDWIPADSFIQRSTKEDYDWYIGECKKANMNMIRVWGGGHYEDERFYDACDEKGILVWQDCAFACNLYPFHVPEFAENVHREIIDNVRRLRHRASLALWCANNECEAAVGFVKKAAGDLADVNVRFYHFTLRDWIRELDASTAFWPGSPSSGHYGVKASSRKVGKLMGDTHLWSVWHGLFDIEEFNAYKTRFCSEFGMESMPVMKTIHGFHPEGEVRLLDPVMLLHQKCGSGNQKMLYYLLAKYREPKRFEDFVYLSQIVQSDTVRYATECWKRNIGMQNGAIYWQLNDCWPVASWAAVDYNKQKKAILYHSGMFNKMLMISNDYHRKDLDLYVINEYPSEKDLTLSWTVSDFSGIQLACGSSPVQVGPLASVKAIHIDFRKDLKGIQVRDVFLNAVLKEQDAVVDEKSYLLVPDKQARLPKPNFKVEVAQENGKAAVRVRSDCYARHVFVDSDALTSTWDDNYITILPGETACFTADNPGSVSAEAIRNSLTIQNMAEIESCKTEKEERKIRRDIFFDGKNWLLYLLCKLFM